MKTITRIKTKILKFIFLGLLFPAIIGADECVKGFIPALPSPGQCFVTGCNGKQCTREPARIFDTCEWQISDQCYIDYGICEEDENKRCRWRPTEELHHCITLLKQEIPPSITWSDVE